jgi:hypothetical protein
MASRRESRGGRDSSQKQGWKKESLFIVYVFLGFEIH